ncbi:MAG: glutathione synthase [Thiogranum sp.]|nr:glutathione synthase [Thiogranum sp.]
MTIRLGIVMDPIESIKTYKDSSFSMLLAAQARGWDLFYMEQPDIFLRNTTATAAVKELTVRDSAENWFSLSDSTETPLSALDVILIRKDPPFDMEYMYMTILLERAEADGVLVVNRPASVRNCNEKLFTSWFPDCCVDSTVSRKASVLRSFLEEHHDIILKPLDAMGGSSVFRVRQGDPNISVILETLTAFDQRTTMAQKFIPEISSGDKRILMIDGDPVPYALARIPAPGETRGNLAAGGSGVGVELSKRDRQICSQVGPELRNRGLLFVGLDVIGDYLTEINVTSPTCIRELDAIYGLTIASDFMDCIERNLQALN